MELVLSTFNCTGLNENRVAFLHEMLTSHCVDILLLQETWLLSSQLNKLSSIHPDFFSHGVSGMSDRSELIRGRPFGGVAILWHRSMAASVKPIKCKNNRLCAVLVTLDQRKMLLVNVYLPCDNYSQSVVEPDYQNCLDDALCLWLESDADLFIIGGDFNTDPRRNNAHCAALANFVSAINGDLAWNCNPNYPMSDTYFSYDGRSHSCIDHFVVPLSLSSSITNVFALENALNASNHLPTFVHVDISVLKQTAPAPEKGHSHSIAWGRVNETHIAQYRLYVSNALMTYQVPECLVRCDSLACENRYHLSCLDDYCMSLCEICVEAALSSFPKTQSNKFNKPKWRERMQPFKDDAMFWDAIWRSCDSPRNGAVFDVRQRTKRQYHYAFRRYQKEEKQLRRERMAEQILRSNDRQFWSEMKKMHSSNVVHAPVVDNASNHGDVAQLFASKYQDLYSSVPSDNDSMRSINVEVNERLGETIASDFTVSQQEVMEALKRLKPNKHDGSESLWSNHLKWAPDVMMRHLASLYSWMLSHAHSPVSMNVATLIPIPKDGDICCSDNYRGIALSSSIAKLMEIILMSKSNASIASSDLQFAYKAKHSTSECTLLLKETVNYYLNRNTDVYGCLIDASKAFDRLQHDKLFQILLKRNVPIAVIRFLISSYRQQAMRVSWRGSLSGAFGVANGVKQGGIFSPVLFCLYMDGLLERLKALGVGCHVGSSFIGALSYADDLTLLSPCIVSLKSMLSECEKFAQEFNILFNPRKSQCIHFTRSGTTSHPTVRLCNQEIKWFTNVKHLGNVVTCDLDESTDALRKVGDYMYYCNFLKVNFRYISHATRVKLFNTYCCVFYGSQCWNLNHRAIQNVCTKFNKGIRVLFNLPLTTHRNLLPIVSQSKPLLHSLSCRFYKLFNTMCNSHNFLVRDVTNVFASDPRSIVSQNLSVYSAERFNVGDADDETKANASLIVDIIDSNFSSDALSRAEMEFILFDVCSN